jgi:hypothetical protein
MTRTLLSVLLALSGGLASAQTPAVAPLPDRPARVQVLRGRATLVGTQGPKQLLRITDSVLAKGISHIEVAAASKVRITWSGVASVVLSGPTSLQWGPLAEVAGERERSTYDVRGIAWKLFDLSSADFEIRRATHLLQIAGHWRAHVTTSAFHMRGLPSGPNVLRHNAGKPLQLEWRGDANRVRPPFVVYAGSEVRLKIPQGSPPDVSQKADPWGECAWPWREPADTAEQVRERMLLEASHERLRRGADPWWRQESFQSLTPDELGCAPSITVQILDSMPRPFAGASLPPTLPQELLPTETWTLSDFLPGTPTAPAPVRR